VKHRFIMTQTESFYEPALQNFWKLSIKSIREDATIPETSNPASWDPWGSLQWTSTCRYQIFYEPLLSDLAYFSFDIFPFHTWVLDLDINKGKSKSFGQKCSLRNSAVATPCNCLQLENNAGLLLIKFSFDSRSELVGKRGPVCCHNKWEFHQMPM